MRKSVKKRTSMGNAMFAAVLAAGLLCCAVPAMAEGETDPAGPSVEVAMTGVAYTVTDGEAMLPDAFEERVWTAGSRTRVLIHTRAMASPRALTGRISPSAPRSSPLIRTCPDRTKSPAWAQGVPENTVSRERMPSSAATTSQAWP